MKTICKFILWLSGWKVKGRLPRGIEKCVLIVAPHTSIWDFIIGRMGFSVYGFKGRFIIKKEFFFFPLGVLLKWLGAVPIDRTKGATLISTAVSYFERHERFVLVITPEGTRKKTDHWKRGFHVIARKANVPVIIGTVDYKKKELDLVGEYMLTDDVETDLKHIQSFYLNVTAKYPEQYNLSPIYRN